MKSREKFQTNSPCLKPLYDDYITVMNDKAKESSKNFEYPEDYAGSKAAGKLRSEANSLNDTQRDSLMEAGMRIIYGGDAKKTISVRH